MKPSGLYRGRRWGNGTTGREAVALTLRRSLAAVTVLLVVLIAAGPVHSGPNNWVPIGPAPIRDVFPGGATGRASAIAVNPLNGAQIFLGTAAGGVWFSPDAGQTWYPTSDKEASLAIGDIELADCTAAGCTTIYAGTGENAIRRDTYHGAGLLIGSVLNITPPVINWTLVAGGPSSDGAAPADFRGASINDVVRVPFTSGNNTALYITLSSGVTASAAESTVTHPEPSSGYGIYLTSDNAASWAKLTVAGTAGAKPTDLELDPSDEGILYAGFDGRGVFKTTDGGFNWCPLNEGIVVAGCPDTSGLPDVDDVTFDHVEIALFNSNVMYATFGHCSDPLLGACDPTIYMSIDGGMNWSFQGPSTPSPGVTECISSYSRYTHALAIHPLFDNVLWLGGIRLCLSVDNGQTFVLRDKNIAPGGSQYARSIHYDHRELVYDPVNATQIYDTSDGGFAVSTNSGTDWRPANDGLQITGFHSIATASTTPIILGGAQDNGCMTWAGARMWDNTGSCGDGGSTMIDADDPMKLYAVTNVAANIGFLTRSKDGGASWSVQVGPAPSDPRSFYPPMAQDPSPPHPLYFGTNKLYRSTNDGDIWAKYNGPWPLSSSSGHDEIYGGVDVITTIEVAPSRPERIYVGYYGGGLFRPVDGNPNFWLDISSALPVAPITDIAVDAADEDTVYVTVSGFGHNHVWKTIDAGATWNAIVTNLPADVPANTIDVLGSSPLWLGLDSNDGGDTMYKSTDGGASWTALGNGLPNAPVYAISIRAGKVFAATHGRGAFVLGDSLTHAFTFWNEGALSDIGIWGSNMEPDQTCTVEVMRIDGTPCASGSVDAMGGTIGTDASGVLGTSREGFFDNKPLTWACFDGSCVGGASASDCSDVTDVQVVCPAATGSGKVFGPQLFTGPPSARLTVDLGTNDRAGTGATQQLFDVSAGMHAADTSTRSLCSVHASIAVGDQVEEVLQRVVDGLNDSSTCSANGVSALLDVSPAGEAEDTFPAIPRLRLQAPAQQGTLSVPALHVGPGNATSSCFELAGLGIPVKVQAQAMALRFETDAAGAMGGSVTLVEDSGLGACAVTVPTVAGQTAEQIAQAVASAFQAPGIPGPHPDCPARRNLRDATATGATLRTVMARDLRVCVTDPGVGFFLASVGLSNVHPIADAGLAETVECTDAATSNATLNGSVSSDPDSTPGTQDDIVLFEWIENFGTPSELLLGSGVILDVALPLGSHAITLRVTDSEGHSDTANVIKTVEDTIAPTLSLDVDPLPLWPPNHRMVDVTSVPTAADACATPSVVLTSLVSNESDDAPGQADGETVDDVQDADFGVPDFVFKLRAERDSAGSGRTYDVSYTATDGAGNATTTVAPVEVPLEQNGTAEPLTLLVSKNAAGTLLSWNPVPGALHYNAIVGLGANIQQTAVAIDLGAVQCLESASADENTVGDEDALIPAAGEMRIYLVEYNDGLPSGYGTESTSKPRVPSSGACPP